jgi:RNA polymerase sigma-70 factor (ECF subfamily)
MNATRERIDEIFRADSRRVLATLIRLLGDFDLAEEALQDAFVAALDRWPGDGVPANPRAWLISAGRFRAIDRLRRRARHDESLGGYLEQLEATVQAEPLDDETIGDDRLRLIFTCCHPALSLDSQIGLTLREVCGLTTEEVARAFLTPAPTLAQRIVRAKAKIRDARIPYEIPARQEMRSRLDGVLHVIYLVFNEGYLASSGPSLTRADLCNEAIRLGGLLVETIPETDAEAQGLLALMLLHDSRRVARASASGEVVLLEEQDRSLWDRTQIARGIALVEQALRSRTFGQYSIQAAIAAVHAEAASAVETDWRQIVALYDLLRRADDSPVVRLNRAAAIAMRDGPEKGIVLIDEILAGGHLAEYHLIHSARADLLRRLGRMSDARAWYETALSLAQQESARKFLRRRLAELQDSAIA